MFEVMALNLPDGSSFGTFLNSGHQVTPGVRMRIRAFGILGDYISIQSEAACTGQHFPSLTEVPFGMSEERTAPQQQPW